MSDSDSETDSHLIPPEVAVVLMVIATVVVSSGIAFGLTSVGLLDRPPQFSTSGALIDDTSEEQVYYVQIDTGSPYDILPTTVRTTNSVYIDEQQSTNISIETEANEGIEKHQLYTNPTFDPENPPNVDTVYNIDTPQKAQLVKVRIEDPSKESTIRIAGEDGYGKTAAVQEWNIPPASEREGTVGTYQFDVEDDRLEIYPGSYLQGQT